MKGFQLHRCNPPQYKTAQPELLAETGIFDRSSGREPELAQNSGKTNPELLFQFRQILEAHGRGWRRGVGGAGW